MLPVTTIAADEYMRENQPSFQNSGNVAFAPLQRSTNYSRPSMTTSHQSEQLVSANSLLPSSSMMNNVSVRFPSENGPVDKGTEPNQVQT